MRARVLGSLAIGVALGVGVGCGALLDLPSEPTFVDCLDDCGAGSDATPSDAVLDAGITFGGGDGSDIGDACGLASADDDEGIFVLAGGRDAGRVTVCDAAAPIDAGPDADAAGLDAAVCVTLPGPARGTRENPCTSVQEGVDLAAGKSKEFVYVGGGHYTEALRLRAGVTVVGAWNVADDMWSRACDVGSAQVVIQAPSDAGATVTADTLGGRAALAAVTLKSKTGGAQAGESVYGVFARGTTTEVTLNYVFVEVASAGDGALGKPGANGVTPTGCATPGTGLAATAPGSVGSPAAVGAFAQDGWHTPAGGAGTAGAAGQNGALGGNGTCVGCVQCQKVAGNCSVSGTNQICGGRGLAGCGGAAGGGGGGGGGGGASVALFVWGANVTVLGGALQAAAGGAGNGGGTPGNPGPPGAGATGPASAPCGTTCPAGGSCQPQSLASGQGGSPGTPGGAGTAGGSGGAGGGGAACSYFHGGAGAATVTNARLGVGFAGKGAGGGAADGISAFECQ